MPKRRVSLFSGGWFMLKCLYNCNCKFNLCLVFGINYRKGKKKLKHFRFVKRAAFFVILEILIAETLETVRWYELITFQVNLLNFVIIYWAGIVSFFVFFYVCQLEQVRDSCSHQRTFGFDNYGMVVVIFLLTRKYDCI